MEQFSEGQAIYFCIAEFLPTFKPKLKSICCFSESFCSPQAGRTSEAVF